MTLNTTTTFDQSAAHRLIVFSATDRGLSYDLILDKTTGNAVGICTLATKRVFNQIITNFKVDPAHLNQKTLKQLFRRFEHFSDLECADLHLPVPRMPLIGSDSLHTACRFGNLSAAAHFIDALDDEEHINLRDSCGLSPIHHAVLGGHANVLKLLVENDADPFIPTAENVDAFALSPRNDCTDVLRFSSPKALAKKRAAHFCGVGNTAEFQYEFYPNKKRYHMYELISAFLKTGMCDQLLAPEERAQLVAVFDLARNFTPASALTALKKHQMLLIPTGSNNHAIDILINQSGRFMAICNRGSTGNLKNINTLEVFRINPFKLDEKTIRRILQCREWDINQACHYLYQTLPALLSPLPNDQVTAPVQDEMCKLFYQQDLKPKLSKYNVCAGAAAKAALRTALIFKVCNVKEKLHVFWDKAKLAKTAYKEISTRLRAWLIAQEKEDRTFLQVAKQKLEKRIKKQAAFNPLFQAAK
jgi:hypothetical protein